MFQLALKSNTLSLQTLVADLKLTVLPFYGAWDGSGVDLACAVSSVVVHICDDATEYLSECWLDSHNMLS